MDFRGALKTLIDRKIKEKNLYVKKHDLICDEIITLQAAFDQDVKQLSKDDRNEMVEVLKEIIRRID